MCGVVGIFERNFCDVDYLHLTTSKMRDAIAHRGPDGEGAWMDAEAGIALAHRRLAIIGRGATGNQPMTSANGRFVICFNGEIYNFNELRSHPSLCSVVWRGGSDTEVLLESFAHRGVDATLTDINGMFAIALYDRDERRLFLIRDRLGIKPLYFSAQSSRFIFGSELRSLKAVSGQFTISIEALASYLNLAYVPDNCSIFNEVDKVQPGEIVTVNRAGDVHRKLYWRLSETSSMGLSKPFTGSDTDALEHLNYLINSAVTSQLVAEVPVGIFLSGGIDSATIAAVASSSCEQVQTLSIGFDDPGFDEAHAAEAVAAYLKTDHTTLRVSSSDALDIVPQLSSIYDEPFADSSQIPTYLVSKLAKDNVTVALSGDGGDELFGGYNRHFFAATYWDKIEALPKSVRQLFSKALHAVPRNSLDRFSHLNGRLPPQLGLKLQKLANVVDLEPNELYRCLISQNLDLDRHLLNPRDVVLELANGPERLIDRMRLSDMQTYLPGDVLTKVDRASMSVGLEVRPPFLDHKLVEFAWTLPSNLLVRSGRSKWILRSVLERYLPKHLIDRPKRGFGIPLSEWLRGPLRDFACDLIESNEYGGGILNPEPARQILRDHLTERTSNEYGIWTLLMFEAWRLNQ
ncbi:asparagine synthase (glutamine-hydrolyzing) [Roseobacter sp. HKCCD7870]|uniref:asparagine synthase (glutamine-hydrolyzing) n=1 Tax=Roseobacter sp. HKCCD7870 TaxID=3120343 RepID=UPI0030ED907F